jgi:acyl-ACP thioesterase
VVANERRADKKETADGFKIGIRTEEKKSENQKQFAEHDRAVAGEQFILPLLASPARLG